VQSLFTVIRLEIGNVSGLQCVTARFLYGLKFSFVPLFSLTAAKEIAAEMAGFLIQP